MPKPTRAARKLAPGKFDSDINVRLASEMKKAIAQQAAHERRDFSQMIRELIHRGLEGSNGKVGI